MNNASGLYNIKKMQERNPFTVDSVLVPVTDASGGAVTLATITVPDEAFSVMGALGYLMIHSVWRLTADASAVAGTFSIEVGGQEVLTKSLTPSNSATAIYYANPVYFWNQAAVGSQRCPPSDLIVYDGNSETAVNVTTLDTGAALAVEFIGNSGEATATVALEFGTVQVWPM